MKESIDQALMVLQRGGLILYPTDTIWGIGCDATNEEAVRRVYELKRRHDAKALLVLVDSMAKVQACVKEMPDVSWDLVEVADRPLTIVYPGARNLAPNLIADDGSVGIRVTNEVFSRTLCQRFKRPLVSTSANITGQPSPSCFKEISQAIIQGVDYVVEYGQQEATQGRPSSIIKLGPGGQVVIIRP
jgi:L-threonylcarbamoyladenylate synthase